MVAAAGLMVALSACNGYVPFGDAIPLGEFTMINRMDQPIVIEVYRDERFVLDMAIEANDHDALYPDPDDCVGSSMRVLGRRGKVLATLNEGACYETDLVVAADGSAQILESEFSRTQ